MVNTNRAIVRAILILGTVLVSMPLLSTDTWAIAAWARKYGVSCNVCHVAGYKLTRTGQKFLREGHALPGAEKGGNLSDYMSITAKLRTWGSRKEAETLSTGAEAKESRSSFEAHALSLYTGGPLDSGFSYFAEMYMHENEKKNPVENTEKTESDMGDWARSKLAELYLQYMKPIGDSKHEMFFTARMGRIMPWLIHLHGGGARLEYSRPLALTSQANSANPYRAFARQFGASAGLGYKDAFAELGLVNGTGKYENTVEVGTDTHKDIFFTLDYAFGDKGSMAGVYYYRGMYPTHWQNAALTTHDSFNQLGLFGNYTFEHQGIKGAVIGSYLMGTDKYNAAAVSASGVNPAVPFKTGYEQKSVGYYVEVQSYLRNGDLAPYFRWDYFDPDTDYDDNETSGPVLGLHYKPLEHGRFVLEYAQTKAKNASYGRLATTETTNKNLTLEMQFMF